MRANVDLGPEPESESKSKLVLRPESESRLGSGMEVQWNCLPAADGVAYYRVFVGGKQTLSTVRCNSDSESRSDPDSSAGAGAGVGAWVQVPVPVGGDQRNGDG